MTRAALALFAGLGAVVVAVGRMAVHHGYSHYSPKLAQALVRLAAGFLPRQVGRSFLHEWNAELAVAAREGKDALAWAASIFISTPVLAARFWTPVAVRVWPLYRWASLGLIALLASFSVGPWLGTLFVAALGIPYSWTWDRAVETGDDRFTSIAGRLAHRGAWVGTVGTVLFMAAVSMAVCGITAILMLHAPIGVLRWLVPVTTLWCFVLGVVCGGIHGLAVGVRRHAARLRST